MSTNKNYVTAKVLLAILLAITGVLAIAMEKPIQEMKKTKVQRVTMVLPEAPEPVGAYEAVVIRNGIGMVSGQFPITNGSLAYKGKVGETLTVEDAQRAAELTALNVLSQIKQATNGFLHFAGLIRIEGYVASVDGFTNQAEVLNGASNVFNQYLGEKGTHARAAFSVSQLPLNSPVKLTVTFAVTENEFVLAAD